MSTSGGRAVSVSRLLAVLLVLLGLFLLRDSWLPVTYRRLPYGGDRTTEEANAGSTQPIQQDNTSTPPSKPTPATCRDVPGADNVMVLLKTGATEIYQKLPSHFLTTFKCVPHFMIFSDLAQDFADYPVYDAIEDVSQHYREEHADFELYRKLQQYQREGQDTSKLRGAGSWNLDKWKFFPMLQKAFTTAPDNVEWFVVIEADTSISWTNLLQFLRTMDPKQPFYLGAQNVIGDQAFAHGGSGVILSRKAADLLGEKREYEGKETWDRDWERIVSVSCCGDEVISRALGEAGVHLTPAWPLIQGETVSTLDWTGVHWCSVAISWHHVTPIELDSLWQFESDWIEEHGWDTPYLYRDVFEHFIQRHVTVNRAKWNNKSKDRKLVSVELATEGDEDFSKLNDFEKNATTSEDACAEACRRMPEKQCIQWMFSPGRCHLGKDIRFGKSDEAGDMHWTSGWIQPRLQRFKEGLANCAVRWAG
ncbi:uncharacterized protein LTR77_006143 [Saxophila tyrrhenica]|uniref:N-acetylgalactosaminide beta-1,3-galactosyltransferase n=1 Tax=Saxophila tyrrhenica TaxID=1690608 RepID=A0AAV9PAJ2_9PEZI|nr:hypothetical protein LTR77_006143 [Saxophila tyrrhenica]